jgi:hypothetical protein
MRRLHLYILSGILLCGVSIADDETDLLDPTRNKVLPVVSSQGVTNVDAKFGGTLISVTIATHEVDIGKPSDPEPEKKLTNCTYSRTPCSLVDLVEIEVSAKDVLVPRSVFADVADVHWATLRQAQDDKFVLIFVCGDASETYTLEVTFDREMVLQRERIESGAQLGEISERTSYFKLPVLDN